MKNPFVLLLGIFLTTSSLSAIALAPSKTDLSLIEQANRQLQTLLKNVKASDKVIKVVYFYPADKTPLPGWQERLPRTLADVSDFYRESFERYHLKSKGLPFEKANGVIVLHTIRGDSASRSYNTNHGSRIQLEIQRKSNGAINFSTDHVLIISGLCETLDDGSYLFHAPYHGTGSTKNGVCMVADCALLDTKLLRDTVHKMTFTEMAVSRKTCTVAEFNSWYIGGIAHEMGHIFGLPHDFGGPNEFDAKHTSLMGEFGSRHFRDYLWNGEKSAEFSTASMLQLMSHPIFSGKTWTYPTNLTYNFQYLGAEIKAGHLLVHVNYDSNADPYGIVALWHSVNQTEYLNRSYSQLPQKKGGIDFDLSEQTPGNYVLRLIFLYPNSLTREQSRLVEIDSTGSVELVDPMAAFMPANPQRMMQQLRKQSPTPEVLDKLEILRKTLDPPVPFDPSTYPDSLLYLSDAKWESAKVGYFEPARNHFNMETERNFFLQLCNKFYSKGLYAHSTSSYQFKLGGRWKSFSAIVGLRDNAMLQGSARFTVLGDGKVLYRSPDLRVNQQNSVQVDLTGVQLLELQAEGTEGHNFNSWAIWVNPLLKK